MLKRKAIAIGAVALGLVLTAGVSPFYSRIETSAQNFQQYFQDLNQSGNSLNPVERFVFSLVLANSDLASSQK